MSNVIRHETTGQRLARLICESPSISWGTTVPYHFGCVGFSRIGFADIPVVAVRCWSHSVETLVPLARQAILRHVKEKGLDTSALDLLIHVQRSSGKQKFKDENRASDSYGKSKLGPCGFYWMEITRRESVKQFESTLVRIYNG